MFNPDPARELSEKLCFLIHESYVRSVKRYCFIRKYAAVPVHFSELWLVCTYSMAFCLQSVQLLLPLSDT